MIYRFLRKARVGLEIKPAVLRLAASMGTGAQSDNLLTKAVEIPEGTVSFGFSALNIRDRDGLREIARRLLGATSLRPARRAALSLPDSTFRVQSLEFDQLPGKRAAIEQLVRWRLDKTAAFDTSDTMLHYQIFRRQDKGFLLLAAVVKTDILSQYEELILSLGLEPWTISLSSLHSLNFYYPYIAAKTPSFAFALVSCDSFTTIVVESEGLRFYRFKEIKGNSADNVRERLFREMADSLHFYVHMDRQKPSEVRHLYITIDGIELGGLVKGLLHAASLELEILSPALVLGSKSDAKPEMAAALGAWSAL